jgi:DNA polymerase-3 subunit gamma/tau
VASWGGGALQFIEGSSKEKNFLEQESKGWNPDHLLKIMDFCAQILPQVRMGMRSDVLSGLFLNKLIEHGSLVTKELEKTQKPHPLSPEDHPAFKEKWEKVLANLLYGEIHIYCALLFASVFLEKNVLSLKFPDYCKYSMELVSIERNSFVLQQKIKEVFEGELTLRIICGDKTTECDLSQSPLLAEIEEAIVEIQDEPTSSLPFDDLPPTAEIRPEFGNEQEDDETVFSGLVDTVLRWGGGEVLLHKKDNVEELDGGITEE